MDPKDKKPEVDNFFDGLPEADKEVANIFDAEIPEKGEKKEDPKEEEPEGRKNRRHRRLEKQLQTERELRIAAEAKAEGRAEAEGSSKEASVDGMPASWKATYGDSPESRQAWAVQSEIMAQYAEQAKTAAIAEIEHTQAQERAAQKEFETFIDNELESIEDEFDVDVTSNSPAAKKARREFLDLVQQLSPKDEDGQVTGYADFQEAFKIYQEKKSKPDNSRQKEIASRSMERPGSETAPERKQTPGFFGWRTDMNL